MKTKSLLFLLLSALILFGCQPPQSGYKVVSDATINDQAIVLTYDEVNEFLPEGIGQQKIVVVDAGGNYLPSQCDDLDKDGQWDELAFLIDLEAGVSRTVYFDAVSAEEVPDFPKRTNIRFGYKEAPFAEVEGEDRLKTTDSPSISAIFQMEGPAWENDLVGFRNYYDARNGIDIFGKVTTDMVLDSVGIRGQNYHEMDDWGMDILKVGSSLGAGAIGLRIGDQVFRIGPSDRGTYEFITEGPVRAILKLNYFGFQAAGRTYDIEHQISIYAGDHFYRSKVTVDGLQGDEQLVTGIVNMHQKEYFTMQENGFQIIGSHGAQAYLGENLGMALLVPADEFIEFWKAPDEGDGVVETHMVSIRLSPEKAANYCFFSGWEYQNEGFKTAGFFRQKLSHATIKIAEQVTGRK